MSNEELQRIKDISCDFSRWKFQNCIAWLPDRSYLIDPRDGYEDKLMSFEEMFDYYIHEIQSEIEIDNCLKDKL